MRGRRWLLGAMLLTLLGCRGEPAPVALVATSSETRAARRLYPGAPPVIPHAALGGSCTTCHTTNARAVPGVGLAPANPHLKTPSMSETSRCVQCHVFQTTTALFADNAFAPLRRPTHGARLYPQAPPVVPHPPFMREDCAACHTGDSARAELRCTHAERRNCVQCHVWATAKVGEFTPP